MNSYTGDEARARADFLRDSRADRVARFYQVKAEMAAQAEVDAIYDMNGESSEVDVQLIAQLAASLATQPQVSEPARDRAFANP